MFVRIVWLGQAAGRKVPGGLRRPQSLPRRDVDDLGVPPRDFDRMTRGLFDRQG